MLSYSGAGDTKGIQPLGHFLSCDERETLSLEDICDLWAGQIPARIDTLSHILLTWIGI